MIKSEIENIEVQIDSYTQVFLHPLFKEFKVTRLVIPKELKQMRHEIPGLSIIFALQAESVQCYYGQNQKIEIDTFSTLLVEPNTTCIFENLSDKDALLFYASAQL
jgi:hypothetical protein